MSLFLSERLFKHLPPGETLVKSDLQKFLKRLRKQLDKEKRKIRYYACGEYGEESQRPHYHLIIYGLSLHEKDKNFVKFAWDKCDWKNKKIESGSFGMVEPESINYVCKYIEKQLNGEQAEVVYQGREPVFKIASQGIGRNWCDRNAEQIRDNLCITKSGINMSIPRYYVERLNLDKNEITKKAKENEYDLVESKLGLSDMSRDDCYKALNVTEVKRLEQSIANSKKQHDKTLKARINLRKKIKI